jgi:hypothetical protein
MPLWLLGLSLREKLLGFLLVALLIFYGGWWFHSIFYNADRVDEMQGIIDFQTSEAARAKEKAKQLEAKLTAIETKYNQVISEIDNEIKKPEYNCIVPESGKLLYNKALAAN